MQVKQSCASLAAVFCLWGKVSDGATFVRVGPGWRKGDFGLAQPAITALAIAIRLPAQELPTSHGTSAWSCKITDSSRVKIRAQPLLKAQTAKRGNGSQHPSRRRPFCIARKARLGSPAPRALPTQTVTPLRTPFGTS